MQAPSAPSSGDNFDLKANVGNLLYVKVIDIAKDIQTVHGTSDAIKCDVTPLDGADKGDTKEGVLIFPRVLVSQLSQSVGTADPVVVGRLGQGLAKPGKSAPWILNAPSEADLEVARKFEAYANQRAAAQSAPF